MQRLLEHYYIVTTRDYERLQVTDYQRLLETTHYMMGYETLWETKSDY